MEDFIRKNHWENIYQSKSLESFSWYEPKAQAALRQFKILNIPKHAKIIDIGGGDSLLVDHLLQQGYKDITVLDISEMAIKRAQLRLGHLAQQVKWVVSDVLEFKATEKYDYWFDRAAFHFLTKVDEIAGYLQIMNTNTNENALASVGTFSVNGPKKCSGIAIKQYNEQELGQTFTNYFEKLNCEEINHCTPNQATQQFIFCNFKKR